MTIARRVRLLVDISHRGSVNAAARDSGVPQRTLARIVDGSVVNPRADVLRSLATFYGVTLDWLVQGRGEMTINNRRIADALLAHVDARAERERARIRERLGVVDTTVMPLKAPKVG